MNAEFYEDHHTTHHHAPILFFNITGITFRAKYSPPWLSKLTTTYTRLLNHPNIIKNPSFCYQKKKILQLLGARCQDKCTRFSIEAHAEQSDCLEALYCVCVFFRFFIFPCTLEKKSTKPFKLNLAHVRCSDWWFNFSLSSFTGSRKRITSGVIVDDHLVAFYFSFPLLIRPRHSCNIICWKLIVCCRLSSKVYRWNMAQLIVI